MRNKCPDGCRKGIQKEVSGHFLFLCERCLCSQEILSVLHKSFLRSCIKICIIRNKRDELKPQCSGDIILTIINRHHHTCFDFHPSNGVRTTKCELSKVVCTPDASKRRRGVRFKVSSSSQQSLVMRLHSKLIT